MAVKKKKIVKAKPAKAKKPAKASKPVKKAAKPVAKKPAAKAAKPAKAEKADKKATKKAAAPAAPVAKKTPPAAKKPVEEVVIEATVVEEVAEEIVLTDAEGRRYCRVKDCDQVATVDGYCRYHYLLFWKKIQVRKKILSEGKLERYIEELTARYPDKFLDMLRKDLRSEKEFLAAIQELEIDESSTEGEFEDETQTYIDEVRGISETTSTGSDDGEF